MKDFFTDILSTAKDGGLSLLKAEIAQHGSQPKPSRPDPADVPAPAPATPGTQAPGMDKKTMIYAGAALVAAALVLALILKK